MSQEGISEGHSSDAVDTEHAEGREVSRGKRRRFTSEYKRRILEEADDCSLPGEVGALLRREGLYSSHLTTWRRQRAKGQLEEPPPAEPDQGSGEASLEEEVKRLRRENKRLQERLRQAETILEVQRKLSQMLGYSRRETKSGAGE